MVHVLALAIQKGDVSKTTASLSLGIAFDQGRAWVPLIGIDPHANFTRGLGIDSTEVEYSIYEDLLNTE